MANDPLEGAADTAKLFDRMVEAAREELGVDLAILGRDYLALQQTRVPKDTGALEAGLSVELQLAQLRVRIGLLNTRPGRSSLYYGRFVEFGRSAQTVLVQRRRRVNGNLLVRRGRKRVEDIAATYRLNVKARAARPYVEVPDADLDSIAAARLADFWSKTFARAGA